jgi:hypothetical protein
MARFLQLSLLLTLLSLGSATIYIYSSSVSTANFYSAFTLAYASSTSNLTIVISPNQVASYNILLWRPN